MCAFSAHIRVFYSKKYMKIDKQKFKSMMKLLCLGFISSSFLVLSPSTASSDFYGSSKVGLQIVGSDRYGASYYVSKNYTSEKDWPLVVILYSDEAQKGDVAVETWLNEVKKHDVLALFVSYFEPKGSPFGSDTRLLKLIRYLNDLYKINQKKVLLVGFGDAAHYAFYAADRYSEYFSSVALIGGNIKGRFDSLIHNGNEDGKSISYLVTYGSQDQTVDPKLLNVSRQNLEKQGYHVTVEAFQGLEHKLHPEFCTKVLSWFDGVSASASSKPSENKSFSTSGYLSSLVRGVFKG